MGDESPITRPEAGTPRRQPDRDWRRWLDIAGRVLAAAVGGYAFAYAAAGALALALPMARPDGALVGAMIAFVLYTVAVLWCFAARSALQAWLALIAVTGPLALFAFAQALFAFA